MVLLIRIVQVNFAWQFIQSKILFGGYMVYETMCWEDTFNLGKKIGQQAKPGQVICLNGDLGVGKTVFTQGFAKGLGIEETVNSPTFTIIQV